MTPGAPRLPLSGPGWHSVRLDNGERVQVMALNPPWDVPELIEWPVGSGSKRRIVEVADVLRA